MENFKLDDTVNTPRVILDKDAHLIEFEGDSRPEDVQSFYNPILDWLEEYTEELNGKDGVVVTCNFKFEYFNSSSAKYVMDIISMLGEIQESSSAITLKVNWHYDEMDEDMLDAGKEFEDMLEVPFNFVAIE